MDLTGIDFDFDKDFLDFLYFLSKNSVSSDDDEIWCFLFLFDGVDEVDGVDNVDLSLDDLFFEDDWSKKKSSSSSLFVNLSNFDSKSSSVNWIAWNSDEFLSSFDEYPK